MIKYLKEIFTFYKYEFCNFALHKTLIFRKLYYRPKISSDKLNLLPKPGNSPKLAKMYNRTYSDSTASFQIEMSYLLVL